VGGANVTVRGEVLKRVASNIGPSFVKYKHVFQLIVMSPEDQLSLQQTGTMSVRQMLIMFNQILFGPTGISIHSTSTTLTALQDRQMPEYTITMVKLFFNKKMQPRRIFRVA
jgi:hypothetical protein